MLLLCFNHVVIIVVFYGSESLSQVWPTMVSASGCYLSLVDIPFDDLHGLDHDLGSPVIVPIVLPICRTWYKYVRIVLVTLLRSCLRNRRGSLINLLVFVTGVADGYLTLCINMSMLCCLLRLRGIRDLKLLLALDGLSLHLIEVRMCILALINGIHIFLMLLLSRIQGILLLVTKPPLLLSGKVKLKPDIPFLGGDFVS